MKWIIVLFQLLVALMFFGAIAYGEMSAANNTVSVVIIIGLVLTVMHVAAAPKVKA